MPKKPQGNDYRMSVDHVSETGQVTANQKIAILVTAGSGRLRLEFEPADALRLADGILAALRRLGGRPVLR
jgi:hypothetical protein